MIAFDTSTKSCQVFKFPKDINGTPKYFSLCLSNRIIYLIENVPRSHYRILSFNPNTKEYKACITIDTKSDEYIPCCFLVQDTIHIIGKNTYQIYCISSNTMKYVHNEYDMGKRGSILITRYRDTMIRFGGWDRGPLDDFYICCNMGQYNKLEKIKWTLKSEWKLLHGLEGCAFVIYKNYLITIGGHDQSYGGPSQIAYTDLIYFLDLDDQDSGWQIADVKAPRNKSYSGVISTSNDIYISMGGYGEKGFYHVHVSRILGDLYQFFEVHGFIREIERELDPLIIPHSINIIVCSYF